MDAFLIGFVLSALGTAMVAYGGSRLMARGRKRRELDAPDAVAAMVVFKANRRKQERDTWDRLWSALVAEAEKRRIGG